MGTTKKNETQLLAQQAKDTVDHLNVLLRKIADNSTIQAQINITTARTAKGNSARQLEAKFVQIIEL